MKFQRKTKVFKSQDPGGHEIRTNSPYPTTWKLFMKSSLKKFAKIKLK